MSLRIHGIEAPLYTKKYIPLRIFPNTGQIQLVMDNKIESCLMLIEFSGSHGGVVVTHSLPSCQDNGLIPGLI